MVKKSFFIFLLFFSFALKIFSFPPPAPHLLSNKKVMDKFNSFMSARNSQIRKLAAKKMSSYVYPLAIGQTKICVILMDFSNKSHQQIYDKNYYYNLMFNPSYNSLNKYYKEVSYDKFSISGTASDVYGWYTSDQTMEHFGEDSGDNYDINILELIKEAIDKADDDIDFSDYDVDKDKIVDHLIVIHAGDDQASSSGNSEDIWSHNWFVNGNIPDTYMTKDGVGIISYSTFAENSPIGIMCHEFGHDISLVDLYKTLSKQPSVVGNYSLMDYGLWMNNGNTPTHLSAWDKILLGWVTPTEISTSTLSYSLKDVNNNAEIIKIKHVNATNPNTEYFLVVNRQKTGYDAYLPGDGILVWHIDDEMGTLSQNDVQNYTHPRVQLVAADGGAVGITKGSSTNFWTNNTIGLTSTSSPVTNVAYNGKTMSEPVISNIGNSGLSMTVSFLTQYAAVSDSIYFSELSFYNNDLKLTYYVDNNFKNKNDVNKYKIVFYNLENNQIISAFETLNFTYSKTESNNNVSFYVEGYNSSNQLLVKSKKINLYDTFFQTTTNYNIDNYTVEISSSDTVIKSSITDYENATKDYIVFNELSETENFISVSNISLTTNLNLKAKTDTSAEFYFTTKLKKSANIILKKVSNVSTSNLAGIINSSRIDLKLTDYNTNELITDNGDFTNYFEDFTIVYRGNIPINDGMFSLFYYDLLNSKWVELNTAVIDTYTLKAATTHFTMYAVGYSSEVSKTKFIAYPNPWTPKVPTSDESVLSDKYGIKFKYITSGQNFSAGTNLKIYTINGELVLEKEFNGIGTLNWNLLNENEKHVASGVYLAFIKTPEGDKIKGKVAVIR